MRLSNIRNLASKYPELLGSVGDSTHLATDKGYATMLVGAYLDDRIRTLEQWSKIMPERSELTKDELFARLRFASLESRFGNESTDHVLQSSRREGSLG